MGTTRDSTLRSERKIRPEASVLLALAMAVAGCSSAQPRGNRGTGGTDDTGGDTGDTGGKGGSATGGKGSGGSTGGAAGMDTGGAAGMGTGGTPAPDAGSTENPPDAATGTKMDAASSTSGDAPPAVQRPDAMGQPCKSAGNEAFTVSAFEPQTGVFTAWFTATPSGTNSVVGLSDGDVGPGSGDTPLHNLHQILIRFSAGGMIDARNGAAYTADTPIPYKSNSSFDFRLVVNVPAKNYSA
ncbi:MAG TPA: hypothetical protein VN914_17635, partial [Polyangia bacterium]|nr:hypothetical protein [Polyangia bacterium]